MDIPDRQLLVILLLVCSLSYLALSVVLPLSQVPTLVSMFLGTNIFTRSQLFRRLVGEVQQQLSKNNEVATYVKESSKEHHDRFLTLGHPEKVELLSAIKSMEDYQYNCKKITDRQRLLFKRMSGKQQRLAENVGYLKRLNAIDESNAENQKLLNDIAMYTVSNYGVGLKDFALLRGKRSVSSDRYRVTEALGHIVRDWVPNQETKPIMDFIRKEIDAIPDRQEWEVVVPGSGLGGIAHELSQLGFKAVHAIEYSGLMYNLNRFMYSGIEKTYKLHPYNHTSSNYYTLESQLRSFDFRPNFKQPSTLHLHQGNFLKFKAPKSKVLVVSVFFIDTAENLLDYMDKIAQLTNQGLWINIGPLKYGTAAQVEFTAQELEKVRRKMGWVDITKVNSLDHHQLVGYLTNTESMWQGYYGLTMWTSKKK